MRKKIMAFLLTAAMVITTIPMNVFAQEVVEREENSTYEIVRALMKTTNLGSASCSGTTACFNSSYFRVLNDDYGYYDGAEAIENYLKNVFIEEEGAVSVNPSSSLRNISYTDALTVINFASAFFSYEEYIKRNDIELPEELEKQKELAIRYFNTVDDSAENYHTHTEGRGMTTPSMAVAVVAMGSLMGQSNTDRFDSLIYYAFNNLDTNFYNSGMYLIPFYQLCTKYDWYEIPAVTEEVLTDNAVLSYYAYGIDLEEEYPDLWDAYVETALADEQLSVAEAKAFSYHYAYQLTNGDVRLGVYGDSRAIVDFDGVEYGEVEKVENVIESIPAIDELTVADSETVQKAREKYEGLSAELNDLVSEKKLETLESAEKRIAILQDNEAAIAYAENAINKIPDTDELTLEDEQIVKAARSAYDVLTEEQKALVSSEILAKLEAAEAKIEELADTQVPEEKPQNPSNDNKAGNDESTRNVPQTDKSVAPVSVGSTVSDSVTKAVYKVTKQNSSENTVEYVGSSAKKASVEIPATITIQGKTYKVTTIGKKAFAGNKALKKVVIGKNIRTIGSKAFSNCKKLKNIKIKTTKLTKKSVGAKAFKGINKKVKINVPNKKAASYKKILLKKGVTRQAVIK